LINYPGLIMLWAAETQYLCAYRMHNLFGYILHHHMQNYARILQVVMVTSLAREKAFEVLWL